METDTINVYSFASKETHSYDLQKIGQDITAGHGGGDTGIMIDLIKYFGNGEPSKSICSINTSFMNHLIAFAAEESRLKGYIVDLEKFASEV